MSSTSDTPRPARVDNGPDLKVLADQWSARLDGLDVRPFAVASSAVRLGLLIERRFAELARQEHGLRPGDLRVLLALRRSGPKQALSPTELFRTLMVTSGAVSKQVDSLEKEGLVTRVADPEILRGLLVRLEPAGADIADATMETICRDFCGITDLSDEQLDDTLDVLTDLLARVEDRSADAERDQRRERA
ncbi:MarR family winged helix-turn-helix transcriptional regulator [Actinomycetospora termitidis]|uniref:MarR family transcriptional regulator n=1 Tax=Actinomycetospora termitidis TaxID=3053470 RepID=A0ABT7M659_9PSEU|nr:MarR family transcriptional regulator [Actinomycetospora sp. Odt1-22]MDL5156136.1 MarR family transcriptional regulator [Actinomycetospora sp. Odt1-22]